MQEIDGWKMLKKINPGMFTRLKQTVDG